jgi:hypothetical protein
VHSAEESRISGKHRPSWLQSVLHAAGQARLIGGLNTKRHRSNESTNKSTSLKVAWRPLAAKARNARPDTDSIPVPYSSITARLYGKSKYVHQTLHLVKLHQEDHLIGESPPHRRPAEIQQQRQEDRLTSGIQRPPKRRQRRFTVNAAFRCKPAELARDALYRKNPARYSTHALDTTDICTVHNHSDPPWLPTYSNTMERSSIGTYLVGGVLKSRCYSS